MIQNKKTEASDTSESDDDGMVTVPNLVGKTEDEAKNITKDMKLGIQPMGEEASNQAKRNHFFTGYSKGK